MRAKYKLKHKLPLPPHFKHIYNLFCSLDSFFNLLKHKRNAVWQVDFTTISKMIENSLRRNFKESHFKQIMNVIPDLFIYKWDKYKGEIELFIEIPKYIEEMLNGEKYDK